MWLYFYYFKYGNFCYDKLKRTIFLLLEIKQIISLCETEVLGKSILHRIYKFMFSNLLQTCITEPCICSFHFQTRLGIRSWILENLFKHLSIIYTSHVCHNHIVQTILIAMPSSVSMEMFPDYFMASGFRIISFCKIFMTFMIAIQQHFQLLF